MTRLGLNLRILLFLLVFGKSNFIFAFKQFHVWGICFVEKIEHNFGNITRRRNKFSQNLKLPKKKKITEPPTLLPNAPYNWFLKVVFQIFTKTPEKCCFRKIKAEVTHKKQSQTGACIKFNIWPLVIFVTSGNSNLPC